MTNCTTYASRQKKGGVLRAKKVVLEWIVIRDLV